MIYLASPYTSPDESVMEERYSEALWAIAQLAQGGVVVYSPIVHWHEAAKRTLMPKDHIFWLNMDHAFIDLSEEVMILQIPGWADSLGVTSEIEYATAQGKRITYMEPR